MPATCNDSPVRFRFFGLALGVTLWLGPGSALADEFHYRNVLIGDRASGMGGAYTAISDDTSGVYYNPAGIVHAGERNLSGSVNAWHQTRTTYEDVLGAGDWNRSSAALVPNFFGIVQPLETGVIGFSFVVTDFIQEDQDQTFTDVPGEPWEQFTINLNDNQTEYKIGPSFAMEIDDGLSIGGSLYAWAREQEIINNQVIVEEFDAEGQAADTEWRYTQDQNDEWGFRPVLGLMWEPTERLALGGSIRTTGIVSADNYAILVCHGSSATDPPEGTAEFELCREGEVGLQEASSSTIRDQPVELRLGAAWFHSPRLLFSADLSFHSGHRDQVRGRDVEPTWNAAVGSEYYLSNQWAVRAGLYTNNANTPSDVERFDHVNFLGGTLSLARFTRNSSISLGIGRSEGRGEGQVLPVGSPTQDVRASTTTVFLSSSYTF